MSELLMFYQTNPAYFGLLILLSYLVIGINYVFVNPERCPKHGTNLSLSNRFIGCEPCFEEHLKDWAAEKHKADDEELRRKARVFAEELLKAGVR